MSLLHVPEFERKLKETECNRKTYALFDFKECEDVKKIPMYFFVV